MWQLLQQLRSLGRTVIVVSHDLADVSQHCQAIALLHKGRLLANGSPSDVIAAHANSRLKVELAGPLAQETIFLKQVVSLAGVKSACARDRQLVADFVEREASVVRRVREDILQLVVHLNATVLGYRLHLPDLASAYFNRTGAASHTRPSRRVSLAEQRTGKKGGATLSCVCRNQRYPTRELLSTAR